MNDRELSMAAEDPEARRRTIRRTAIVLGVLAFAWYFGFMALRLL